MLRAARVKRDTSHPIAALRRRMTRKLLCWCFLMNRFLQNGQVFGSAIAGPPFAQTMSEILPYLGIERKYTEEELQKLDTTTPSVTGNELRTAKETISNASLSCKVMGSGDTVVAQIPEGGKAIPKGGTVILYTDESSTETTVEVPGADRFDLVSSERNRGTV